ncbi:MAG: hypothetical protein JWQ53_2312 [Klenkia sp.]|nr:hypothetical protein [Klenkia sp.]
MARPRGFDEAGAVRAAAGVFAARGYPGTSVEDLVSALGIHRGSLYAAFGSKRALYLRVLTEHVHALPGGDLTLLVRAAVERARVDDDVAVLVAAGLDRLRPTTDDLPGLLGRELLAHATRRPEGPGPGST